MGTVFDIKEFSVYDGPGIRSTVFLKGCPLRCRWCHNPEGLLTHPQVMVNVNGCEHCGRCAVEGCTFGTEKGCSGCGRCISLCPNAYRRMSGTVYTPEELARRLYRQAVLFGTEGGVTFSGGEPTLQAQFMADTVSLLREMMKKGGMPRCKIGMQTCGFAPRADFLLAAECCDFLFFDLKLMDNDKHIYWTGVPVRQIHENLFAAAGLGIPVTVRVPLIPGVNDDEENLTATAEFISSLRHVYPALEVRAELLPYNAAAGAKYAMVGRQYACSVNGVPNTSVDIFTERGIECRVLKS